MWYVWPNLIRQQSIYASLPSCSAHTSPSKHYTTVLSARLFHSLSSPPWDPPPEDSEASRRRAMQLILDEVHRLQKDWQAEGASEWVGAGIINSSKVLVVTVSSWPSLPLIRNRVRSTQSFKPLNDYNSSIWPIRSWMFACRESSSRPKLICRCPYNTPLMQHAVRDFHDVLNRCSFRIPSDAISTAEPIILDPVTTHPVSPPPTLR